MPLPVHSSLFSLGACLGWLLLAWAGGTQAQPNPGAASPASSASSAQAAKPTGHVSKLPLQTSQRLGRSSGAAGKPSPGPLVLSARKLSAQPDLSATAEGNVELRRAGLLVLADTLFYEVPEDRITASGQVRIEREGAVYTGRELSLALARFEGQFLAPTFELTRLGAGGKAERVEFLGEQRSRAIMASYTSCPRVEPEPALAESGGVLGQGPRASNGPSPWEPSSSPAAASPSPSVSFSASGRKPAPEPAWELRADRVDLDLESSTGLAEGAQLRFLGVPVLALPSFSFPLGDARKSGWLPPSLHLDNRSGLDLVFPYYLNLAPNRDATLAPRLVLRRGLGLDSEFRYLEQHHEGRVRLDVLPHDRLAGRGRGALRWEHEGELPFGVLAKADVARVSDDEWWRDFPRRNLSLAPRLLPQRLAFERPFSWLAPTAEPGTQSVSRGEGLAYARLHRWQALQATEAAVASPYQRSPQLGVRWKQWQPMGSAQEGLAEAANAAWQVQMEFEAEFNRFILPSDAQARADRVADGHRLHALASLSLPWRSPGIWVAPKLGLNVAGYSRAQALGGAEGAAGTLPGGASSFASSGAASLSRAGRSIPTFSVDSGLEFEREAQAFGRNWRQTLEPRLLYVNTPYRAQSHLPAYDAAAKDFSFVSIYSDNSFSGIDRVADTHGLTTGVTTRLVSPESGAEAVRLALVQRYLFRPQRVAPQADGSPDGQALTQRWSDILLLGSSSLVRGWAFDAAVQYSTDNQRPVRSVVGVRHTPAPFHTVATTYRFARGLTEQVDVGWQWPLLANTLRANGIGAGSGCGGALYAVGRVSYSMKDSRITDSILGLEYDAGCWIARVVAERQTTGRSAATTQLMVQLELVGLSRIGSNPLTVLRDNIPGYRLLREERPFSETESSLR